MARDPVAAKQGFRYRGARHRTRCTVGSASVEIIFFDPILLESQRLSPIAANRGESRDALHRHRHPRRDGDAT